MKMIIGGKHVDARDKKTQDVINPANMQVIDTVPAATEEDVLEAIAIAQKGKVIWKNTPLYERVRIMMKFVELLEQNHDKLLNIMIDETGKTAKSCGPELELTIACVRGFCEKAKTYATEVAPLDLQPRCEGDILMTVREPIGVVAAIVPFNYPAELYMQKAAPALVTGNAVICKPSSDTPLCNIYLTKLLHEAGVPGEVVQVVTGSGAKVGSWLSQSKDVDVISLTGSTEVGVQTALNGAKNLSHVYLELGGNCPMLVFDDADLDKAVAEALFGRLLGNAGQACCAPKRYIVQNGVKEEFTKKLVKALSESKVGDPHDPESACGPLVSERAAKTVEEQIQLTIKQGAKCIHGGKRFNTTFIEPTVLVDVKPGMDVAGPMEIFGPVFPIIGFDTIDQAIKIANDIPYGLSSGVMTRSMSTAYKVSKAMESGTCVVNGSGFYRTAYQAFGDIKMTGIGREGVGFTLDEYTQIKTIVLKKLGDMK